MPSNPAALPAPRVLSLADEAATMTLGAALATGVRALTARGEAGLVIDLDGDLGVGKTTLVRALLRALGVAGRIKSPTFTLVEPYEVPSPAVATPPDAAAGTPPTAPPGQITPSGVASLQNANTPGVELKQNLSIYCYHFDFYRFTDPREFLEAGFREYFNEHSICLVEWPDKVRIPRAPGAQSLLPPADVVVRLEPDGDGRRATLTAGSVRGAACLNAALPPAAAF